MKMKMYLGKKEKKKLFTFQSYWQEFSGKDRNGSDEMDKNRSIFRPSGIGDDLAQLTN